ncbi:MAG: Kef-type K+ transport system membrane component KefB [Planctomycetaceae bacterium]|jgi:Kef-type K+ transport system membrane component KefB
MLSVLDHQAETSLLILLIGGLIVFSLLARWKLEQIGLPSLLGYLAFGFGLRLIDGLAPFLSHDVTVGLEHLAELGIVALLFRVGLRSDLSGLLRQLRKARLIWFGNVLVSGLSGYVASRWLLDMPQIPSLFVGVALTATSVGVPVAVWTEAGRIQSDDGELMLDVAELDDISAVMLIALLLGVVPTLNTGNNGATLVVAIQTGGLLLLKFAVFGGICYFFAKYGERPMTRFFERIEPLPDSMLMVAGVAFMIAALAGLLGFSVALGAFFAGLIFSRDSLARKLDTPFDSVHDLLTPFFFIGIGLHIEPGAFMTAVIPGAILIAVAAGGKVVGTLAPAMTVVTRTSAWLLAVSMIPRAEIAMIVMDQGRQMGSWAVPPQLYAGMVLVCATTSTVAPLALRRMLIRP